MSQEMLEKLGTDSLLAEYHFWTSDIRLEIEKIHKRFTETVEKELAELRSKN